MSTAGTVARKGSNAVLSPGNQNIKKASGGLRDGAGRPPGARNASTVAKERVLQDALARFHNQLDQLSPLEIVEVIMREAAKSGDIDRCVAAAIIALPYRHARLAPVAAPDISADAIVDEIGADQDPEMADA